MKVTTDLIGSVNEEYKRLCVADGRYMASFVGIESNQVLALINVLERELTKLNRRQL